MTEVHNYGTGLEKNHSKAMIFPWILSVLSYLCSSNSKSHKVCHPSNSYINFFFHMFSFFSTFLFLFENKKPFPTDPYHPPKRTFRFLSPPTKSVGLPQDSKALISTRKNNSGDDKYQEGLWHRSISNSWWLPLFYSVEFWTHSQEILD